VDVDGDVDAPAGDRLGNLVQRDHGCSLRDVAKVEVVARQERRQRHPVRTEIRHVAERRRRAMRQPAVARADVEDCHVALGDPELVIQEGQLRDRVEEVAADQDADDVVRLGAEEAVLGEALEESEPVVQPSEVRRQSVAERVGHVPLLPDVGAVAAKEPYVDLSLDVVAAPLRVGARRMSAVAAFVLRQQGMICSENLVRSGRQRRRRQRTGSFGVSHQVGGSRTCRAMS